MQTILLSGLFGGVCAMVLWVVCAVSATRDQMMRRGGQLAPPEER